MKNKTFIIIILISCCSLVSFINNRTEDPSIKLSFSANNFMWENFHLGNYDSIPSIITKLKEAYYKNPCDSIVTAHLGFTYLWAFSERARKEPDPTFSEFAYQSNHFFKEAIKLNPKDARIRGFHAVTEICEGALKKNWFTLTKGYVNGLVAIKKWPQFNKFAFSLIGSQRKNNTPMFKLGMKFQWQLLNDCSCRDLTKKTVLDDPEKVLADLISELEKSTDTKLKRVCWNSWIAPHNLEGFFMNFGDMLVKEGHLNEAKKIYAGAKLSPTFKDWPFQSALEERIRDAESNKIEFNKPLELVITPGRNQIFINSQFSCVACHQMSKREFEVLTTN